MSAKEVNGQYQIKSWTTDNGLPQNTIHSIIQTPDGYLWLATLDGLARFDGVKFTIFNKQNTPGITGNRFTQMLIDSSGDLWIATEESGVTRYRDGRFQTFEIADNLLKKPIRNLVLNERNEIFALTTTNVFKWNGENFVAADISNEIKDDLALRSTNGAFWYIGRQTLAAIEPFANNPKFNKNLAFSADDLADVSKLLTDSRGRLWVGTKTSGLLLFENGNLTVYNTKNGLPSNLCLPQIEDENGNIWALTDKGAVIVAADGKINVLTTEQGLSGNDLKTILRDREGNIWIGTTYRGLNLVSRSSITFFSKKEGLANNVVNPIFQDSSDDIWIGGRDLSVRRGNNFSRIGGRERFSTQAVTAIEQDGTGRLWFGYWGGVYALENGEFTDFNDRLANNNAVYAIRETRGGIMWFATESGLIRYQNDVSKRFTTADGLAGNSVKVICESGDGSVWFGTYGGLSKYQNGAFTSFTTADGLASNLVRSLYEDADGVLWIGSYDGGLTRLKEGKFTRYTSKDGLFNDGVFQILEDERGNFWMSSNRGIYRVAKRQLNDFADGRIMRIESIAFGKEDGLLETECNGGQQPAGIKARDGRLWFPTQSGVAVIDPNTIKPNPHVPPVIIESATIDGEMIAPNGKIEVVPGKNNLEIAYTALSFTKSEFVKFRYRLAGQDADWIEARNRRTAYYSYVQPGEYTFQVIAANSDGVWNTTGASVKIVVVPPFYRTWWFWLLSFAFVGGIVFVSYRRRVTRLEKEKSAQQAFSGQLIESQEQDRKRIAAELHDGLGQSLVIIKNRALMSLDKRENAERAFEQLDEIASAATEAINEVREITYNLRPYQLDRLGLSKAIASMIRRAGDEIEFETKIDNIDGVFPSETEINVYRIVQESINNILKHSKAERAKIKIERAPNAVEILIEDDGKGFERNESTAGFGLIGIGERARMLGGSFSIRSATGQGTKINIKLPVNDSSGGGN